ncbi:MAG: phage portal protein [Lachnospiraceae bacterium]|nr:phage portal protein [Lachnospiraceae bacterium]
MELNFNYVEGLPDEERKRLTDLLYIFNNHRSGNRLKKRYYNGKVTLNEVNLGIALPSSFGKLQIGCAWGAKTVDVLAARSMFDGFVGSNGNNADVMNAILRRNHLITEYKKACREELKYGAVYAAVFGSKNNAKIRFYDPHCAAAKWDAGEGRIECGFVFDDCRLDDNDTTWSPTNVIYHTKDTIWELNKIGGQWVAEGTPHQFGRPLMVAMAWDATTDKPFGQSRLKNPVRRLIQGYVRTIANASIGLEFATSPQKYLLGVSDEQYDALIDERFKTYVGSILYSTVNTETGEKPTFGQLPQGTITPHVEMLRILSTQFSAATGLTVTDVGVVNDANPTSSDAILAQSQSLVRMAEELNEGNGDALYTLGQMALAIELDTTPDKLDKDAKEIIAHFKNPSMPSVAATADAAIKIAASREGFAETDVFLEMVGFDQADIRRIKAQEARARGNKILKEEFTDDDIDEGMAGVHPEDVGNQ